MRLTISLFLLFVLLVCTESAPETPPLSAPKPIQNNLIHDINGSDQLAVKQVVDTSKDDSEQVDQDHDALPPNDQSGRALDTTLNTNKMPLDSVKEVENHVDKSKDQTNHGLSDAVSAKEGSSSSTNHEESTVEKPISEANGEKKDKPSDIRNSEKSGKVTKDQAHLVNGPVVDKPTEIPTKSFANKSQDLKSGVFDDINIKNNEKGKTEDLEPSFIDSEEDVLSEFKHKKEIDDMKNRNDINRIATGDDDDSSSSPTLLWFALFSGVIIVSVAVYLHRVGLRTPATLGFEQVPSHSTSEDVSLLTPVDRLVSTSLSRLRVPASAVEKYIAVFHSHRISQIEQLNDASWKILRLPSAIELELRKRVAEADARPRSAGLSLNRDGPSSNPPMFVTAPTNNADDMEFDDWSFDDEELNSAI